MNSILFIFAALNTIMARILYLSHCGSSVGGGERQLFNLVTSLDSSLYQPTVICPDDGAFSRHLRAAGIETIIRPLPAWRKGKHFLHRYIAASQLVRLVKKRQFRLVHTSDSWHNPYLIRIARHCGIPTVSHVRTPIRLDQVRKYRFHQISMIVSISERFKPPFLEAGIPSDKIAFIHDSVDLNLFRNVPAESNVLKRDFPSNHDVSIGFVGRIEPFKKQLEFVQAAERVIQSRPNARFFLVGGIQSESYFEQVKRFVSVHGLGNNVIFAGERSDMPQVLASLNFLVTLAGGSIVFEAMACGLPVILVRNMPPSNVSWEIVRDGETGFVIPHEDAEPLSDAIIELIDNPELQGRMGKEARKWAEEQFSHMRMTNQTQQIYDGLLQSDELSR